MFGFKRKMLIWVGEGKTSLIEVMSYYAEDSEFSTSMETSMLLVVAGDSSQELRTGMTGTGQY